MRFILLPIIFTLLVTTLANLRCGNSNYYCQDYQTCCPGADNTWACCFHSNGVCCDEGFSCCPAGTYCLPSGCQDYGFLSLLKIPRVLEAGDSF